MRKNLKRTVLALMMVSMLASSVCVVPAFAETGDVQPFTTNVEGENTDATTVNDESSLRDAIKEGAVITLGDDITLSQTLAISNSITINGNGHTLTAGDSASGNFVTITANNVTLENLTLKTGSASKNVLHLYRVTGIALNNVALDHTTATAGAPLIANSSSVSVTGALTLKGGSTSWYGINLDYTNGDATLDLTNATAVTYNGPNELVSCSNNATTIEGCTEGNPSITDPNGIVDLVFSDGQYVTPIVQVGENKYATLEKAIENASENSTIVLLADVIVDKSVGINTDGIILDGNNHKITASGEDNAFTSTPNYEKNLVNVTGDNVVIKNIQLITGSKSRNALSISGAKNVTLENVALDHTTATAGAPLIVGGSSVKVAGALTLKVGEKSWYGINVDTTASGNKLGASIEFAENSSLVYDDSVKPAIYFEHFDSEDAVKAALINPENAGIVMGTSDEDGISYVKHTKHTAKSEWESDETYHWHKCETENCNEVLDKAVHTYTWTVTKEPTYTENGLKNGVCICGATKTEVIPMLTYTPVYPVYPDYGTGSTTTVTKKDGWNKSGKTWYYYEDGVKEKGWLKVKNTWYYLDPKTGAMYDDGLAEIDGETYYFYNWGGMANSFWYLDEETGLWYFFRGNGAMAKSAWIEWKGEYYYVGRDGAMLTSTTTPDGYRVDKDGKWIR